MTTKYNPFQVMCIGEDCELYSQCDNICILKDKFKNHLKGCSYSNIGDCKNCSNKKKCVLIRPYSDKLYKTEVKRSWLEKRNKELTNYVKEWKIIEEKLGDNRKSVTDIIYFKRSMQKMVDEIEDNQKLIAVYREKEKRLLKELSN